MWFSGAAFYTPRAGFSGETPSLIHNEVSGYTVGPVSTQQHSVYLGLAAVLHMKTSEAKIQSITSTKADFSCLEQVIHRDTITQHSSLLETSLVTDKPWCWTLEGGNLTVAAARGPGMYTKWER